MAVGKGIGGYVFHSQALIADAIHALTDLVSDVMTLATVSVSLKPPSERFPMGYGKLETMGALGVSGLLLVGGILMGLNAVEILLTQLFPDIAHAAAEWGLLGHGHSHSHGHGHGHGHGEYIGPNINAAWLAAGSVVVKEWLYRASE
jgi:cation diffusion facilitator family transporter